MNVRKLRPFATRLLAAVAAVALTAAGLMAREINVRGKVTHKKTGEELSFVSINDVLTGRLLTVTDEEGKYSVTVEDNDSLCFSMLGCEDLNVPVAGRLTIDIQLEPTDYVLEEIVVSAKRLNNTVTTEPTDLEVKGNWLSLKSRVKVPTKFYNSSVRVIVQPGLRNITQRKSYMMRPRVVDGTRYHITQNRMYDFRAAQYDPLWPYTDTPHERIEDEEIVTIVDSIYVDDPSEDFRCDMLVALEDYNRVYYRDTTVIARGTVNPLRFLDYKIDGVEVTDETFFPKPEKQLRDTRGDMNLTFKVGKTKLDLDLGDNRRELDNMISQLRAIENDPNSALKSISIVGTASPEGRYDFNLQLAKGRLESTMDRILSQLTPSIRKNIEVSTDARVATWQELADMLRADSLVAEAEEVEKAIAAYPGDMQRQSRAISRLPFYSSLINDTYLPQLRRVSYEVVSSQYRLLTDEEILNIYLNSPQQLSRYEYWKLYKSAPNDTVRRQILEDCMAVHPRFAVGATDLAAMKINAGEPDVDLLEIFIANPKIRIPDETRHNHAAALLADRQYMRADSLGQILPDDPRYHKAKIYSRALSGNFMEVIQEVSADSPLNEVLLLLALKANDQAWRKAQNLGETAREEYVKAVAANRVDAYLKAIDHLERAFELDPSLREVARVDGDLTDLMEDFDQQ